LKRGSCAASRALGEFLLFVFAEHEAEGQPVRREGLRMVKAAKRKGGAELVRYKVDRVLANEIALGFVRIGLRYSDFHE